MILFPNDFKVIFDIGIQCQNELIKDSKYAQEGQNRAKDQKMEIKEKIDKLQSWRLLPE